jgi:hypothetical protein
MNTGRTDKIRKAVASGDWQAALRFWEEYAAGIRKEISCGACSHARLSEARNFLDWAGRMVLCARAHAQNRLNTNYAAGRYAPCPSRPNSSLRMSL